MPAAPGPTWRVLETPEAPGAWNMGLDEALLESVRHGGAPTLRFYRWCPPCLSLGRNQEAPAWLGAVDHAGLEIDVVRRITGGRAVLHHHELTYSAVMADRAIGFPRVAYRLINETLAAAVRGMGLSAASVAAPGRPATRPTGESPCFDDPAAGEVLAGDRKLIGSAQVRLGGVLLQHGSIMLRRSPLLDVLRARGVESVEGSPAYLEAMLPEPPATGALVGKIVESWRERIGELEVLGVTDREWDRADSLALRYADPGWTWKR